MSYQETLVIIKPDAMDQGADVLADILETHMRPYQPESISDESGNCNPILLYSRYIPRMNDSEVRALYQEHMGRHYYQQLIDFMQSGPVFLYVIAGIDIIPVVRRRNGATNPVQAEPLTLRAKYGAKGNAWTGQQNAVHASDSTESAHREIRIFFPNLQ